MQESNGSIIILNYMLFKYEEGLQEFFIQRTWLESSKGYNK